MSSDSLPYLDADVDNTPSLRPTSSMQAIALAESRAIRSELAEIGAVLDLPTRIPTRARSSVAIEESVAKAPVPLWRRHVSIAVIVLGVLGALVSQLPPRMPPLPDDLLGEWATTFADYEDQRLGFSASEIIIGLGGGAPSTRYPISAVKLSGRSDSMGVSLTYRDGGADIEFFATLLLRGTPRLVFQRPAGLVWERKVSAASGD
jgi:hypothetical protein